MKNIKIVLLVLLLGILSLNSFAANFRDTEEAKNGREFMQIFMDNLEYETRYQDWMSEVKKLSPEEKEKGDTEAKKLLENKDSGEVFFKSQDGTLLISSKIDKGEVTSMSMYDKDGVVVKINTGEIITYYRSGAKGIVTTSPDINPKDGKFRINPKNGIGVLYYENGTKAGETPASDHIIFFHKNGKPFIEFKKGWDKEKIY